MNRKYSPEMRERAMRMLAETRPSYPTMMSAVRHVAGLLGTSPETLRLWQRRYEVDSGVKPGLTTDAVAEIKRLQDVPPLRSYVRDRVVLVGDAAHVMAPNLGRGACESLIDAVILARAVADGDVVAGLRRYDAQRWPRTRRIVGAARMLNRVATMSRGFAVRNAAVGLLARLA